MTATENEHFKEVKECVYKGERYSVRDNGAILRHRREGGRARAVDGKWTFGKENTANPYLHISSVKVHRIVATAFHGEPEDSHYVVDHIDTNCRNNRPENLRWLTRLENVLKNPITRKRVEYLCGSIEAFLDNPSLLRDVSGNPNFEWMRAVTPEEAKQSKARMDVWAGSTSAQPGMPQTQVRMLKSPRKMNPLQPIQKWEAGLGREPGLEFAKTPRSAQYMWNYEINFPRCPINIGPDPLDDYVQNTSMGDVLAYSDDPVICPKLTVNRVVYLRGRKAILILCGGVATGWTIVGIEVTDGRLPHFIHFNLGTYSSEVGANEAFIKMESADFWAVGYRNASSSN